jgi:hypothetical protein
MYLGDGSAPKSVQFDKNYFLQTYVFGDGSGNRFRFALDDRLPATSAAYHEVSPWYTIDWTGWRLIRWDLAQDSVGTWIGDGELDGQLRIDSIQLTYSEGGAGTGFVYFDDLQVLKERFVDVADRSEATIPSENQLLQNYPNPFNPETRIVYRVKEPLQRVRLVVYDLLGKEVKVLVDANQPAGSHTAVWNGRDALGRQAASGTYIYRLSAGDYIEARKMVFLR